MIGPALLLALALLIVSRPPGARLEPATGPTILSRLRCGGAPRDGPTVKDTVSDVELFSACLEAGLSHAQAAHAVGMCGGDSAWLTTASLLAVGLDPDTAWAPVRALPGCADIASLASAATRTGASIVAGCMRVADKLATRAADEATAATERAGVLIALPLTMCFLPAFFLLGLVPVLVSLGADYF